MERNKRWYDANKELAAALEKLKLLEGDEQDRIVVHVIGLIHDHAHGLLEKYILDFPLDMKRRRWYDKDPYLWLMVNGLKYASPQLVMKAVTYINKAVK